MAHILADKVHAEIRSVISFHEALDVVCRIVEDYPAERLCPYQAQRLRRAAEVIEEKLAERSTPSLRCDRCKKNITVQMPDDPMEMTGGFYVIRRGDGLNEYQTAWGKYANEGERIVCDKCMWADSRYIEDYGVHVTQF